MNETILEAQARYLIEDRLHSARRARVGGFRRRRHHRFPWASRL